MSEVDVVLRCPLCGGRVVVAPEGHRVCSVCGYVIDEENVSFLAPRMQVAAEVKLLERYGKVRRLPRFRSYEARRFLKPRPSTVDVALQRVASLASVFVGFSEAEMQEARRLMASVVHRVPLNGNLDTSVVAAAALTLVKEGRVSLKILVKGFSERLGVAPKRLWYVINKIRMVEGRKPLGFTKSVLVALDVILSRLGLDNRSVLYEEARRLVERHRVRLGSRSPSAVAAAALYLVARRHGYQVSLKRVSRAAGVTEAAVRSAKKILSDS